MHGFKPRGARGEHTALEPRRGPRRVERIAADVADAAVGRLQKCAHDPARPAVRRRAARRRRRRRLHDETTAAAARASRRAPVVAPRLRAGRVAMVAPVRAHAPPARRTRSSSTARSTARGRRAEEVDAQPPRQPAVRVAHADERELVVAATVDQLDGSVGSWWVLADAGFVVSAIQNLQRRNRRGWGHEVEDRSKTRRGGRIPSIHGVQISLLQTTSYGARSRASPTEHDPPASAVPNVAGQRHRRRSRCRGTIARSRCDTSPHAAPTSPALCRDHAHPMGGTPEDLARRVAYHRTCRHTDAVAACRTAGMLLTPPRRR